MFDALNKFVKKYREEIEEIKLYFQKCADTIDRSNLFMLRRTCMYTSIVYLGMLFLAIGTVPGFKVTVGHWTLIVILIIFFGVNIYTRNHDNVSHIATQVICLSYGFSLFLTSLMAEIRLDTSYQPTRWFPLILMVFPVLYITKQYMYGILETGLFVIYGIVTFLNKDHAAFFRDIYTVLGAFLLSMIIARVILGVRSVQGLSMVELRRYSSMDKLTQVYNKAALLAEMDIHIENMTEGKPCAMSIIDVDNFKHVNDSLGHEGGDLLLEHIGKLLLASFRPTDVIGRFGGDEFVVFMPNMRDPELVENRCEILKTQLGKFNIGNEKPFTLSIGTIIDLGNHSRDELFKMADDALYKSKMDGKNCNNTWTADKDIVLEKPAMVFVTSFDEPRAQQLPREEEGRFKVFSSTDENCALQYISHYHDHLSLIVAEIDDGSKAGDRVVGYVKSRGRFDGIPVLAVAMDDKGAALARDLGADEVLYVSSDGSEFKEAIRRLAKL